MSLSVSVPVREVLRQVATVTPRAPWRPNGKLPSVPVTVVRASEVNPPPGAEPIEWLLLTDLPATTLAEAERVLDGYTHRWLIEVYFRVLKSGCGVEKLQLETAERMANALAVYQIVAWRVLLLTMLGRAAPNVSCETVLTEPEWKAVYVVVAVLFMRNFLRNFAASEVYLSTAKWQTMIQSSVQFFMRSKK